MAQVTPSEAKNLVRGWLRDLGLPEYKLRARTVGFHDLARDSMVFVAIIGWKEHPDGKKVRQWALDRGFGIDFD